MKFLHANRMHPYNLRPRRTYIFKGDNQEENLTNDRLLELFNSGRYQELDNMILEEAPRASSSDEGVTKIENYPLQTHFLKRDFYVISFLFVASLATRLYEIGKSPIVVWDEAHFGKFASWYIKGTFYFDVHPPLGKMLVALFLWLFGYDGSFSFDSGNTYTDVPIAQARALCSITGALIVPLMYATCRNLRMRREVSCLVASMALFENSFVVISKFLLLDPILLFFTHLAIFFVTRMSQSITSRKEIRVMFLTGISLGLVASVKWVGLFTYTFAGLFVIRDLYNLLPLFRYNRKAFSTHFLYRVVCLIVVPAAIYMLTFGIHFVVLHKSGPGDAHMTTSFQASLSGHEELRVSKPVYIDSFVSIRSQGFGGGLLHAHNHAYETGSKQTQVTIYHHRDENNVFQFKLPWTVESSDPSDTNDRFLIQHGMMLRLFHNSTERNLHSHDQAAPISVYDNEVSLYGNRTNGDHRDHWRILLKNGPTLFSVKTRFQLQHVELGCYLYSTGNQLPEWGFNQGEIVCKHDSDSRGSYWNIEQVFDDIPDHISPSSFSEDTLSFLDDFVHLNAAMMHANNGLVPKLGNRDLLVSTPKQWFWMDKGIRMCNWDSENSKYYMLGNPLTWWTGSLSMILFSVDLFFIVIKHRVNQICISNRTKRYVGTGLLLFSGWLLHYLPFFLMGRVTYLHHYFPALSMSFFMTGWILNRHVGRTLPVVAILVSIYMSSFIYFSPLTYGFKEAIIGRQWKKLWNI